MNKLDEILERHADYWGKAGDMQAPGKTDLDTEATKRVIKRFMVELIKSDSDAFNSSDHQVDVTEYANELIAKVETL